MHSGHHEIQPEENLRAAEVAGFEAEIQRRHEMLDIFRAIFETLDHQECDSERRG